MDDLISRQAAIDAIERNAYRHTYIDQIVDIIKGLPSAQPEQLTDKEQTSTRKERTMKKDWIDIDQLQLLYNFAEIVADDVKEEGYSYDKAQGALEGAIMMFFILTDAPTEFLSGIGKEVYERFLEKIVGVNDDI